MKKNLLGLSNQPIKKILLFLIIAMASVSGCKKDPGFRNELPPSYYSADVIDKWMTLEIRLFTNATGILNGAFARPFAYSGICAYESIDPGFAS